MGADGTRMAVTGHRSLADPTAVRVTVDAVLAGLPRPLVCVSALADGADQLVAEAVLDAGGALEAVVPSHGYAASLPPGARERLAALTARAARVTVLPHAAPGADAYAAAGRAMLDGATLLLAVWDREPSRGRGGTADVVRIARERGIPVTVVDARRA